MQALTIHQTIVENYRRYLDSFTNIRDARIQQAVHEAFSSGVFLPDPLLQFNPSFALGQTLDELEAQGFIHSDLKKIFGSYNLYHHQVEAVKTGISGKGFVVTSGTGSGKSLTYLATIFNRILQQEHSEGIKAIIVYPMNALINSQEEEIRKYEIDYLKSFLDGSTLAELESKSPQELLPLLRKITNRRFPVTYAKYTGQEKDDDRTPIKENPPSIILTNYMMLELIMTRNGERPIREAMRKELEYLVFDELHTYRGRQGADVSMLIRRIRQLVDRPVIPIGTSATLASQGSGQDKKQKIAEVASEIFGQPFQPAQIIAERLRSSTSFNGSLPAAFDLQEAMVQPLPSDPEPFARNPLAIWFENRIALKRTQGDDPEREEPQTIRQIAEKLSLDAQENIEKSHQAVIRFIEWVEQLNAASGEQSKAVLPFKIHQFIAQTGNVYVTLESRETREITLETNRYIKKEGNDRALFPVVFSRHSGADFICVRKEGNRFIPRNPDDLPLRIAKQELKGDRDNGIPKRMLNEEDFPDGYLIASDNGKEIWNDEQQEQLPDSWFVINKAGKYLHNYYQHQLPRKVYFDTDGNFSSEGDYPFEGWFIPARLLIDPTSGVIYDAKTNENTKLMRIGNEGRSTATTVMSFSIIKSLHEAGIAADSRKLLSFTDNRQDASLQAGHFNDFMMLGMLRSAIYQALKDAPGNRLTIETIADAVFRKLNLPESEYAKEPSIDPGWPDPENEKAIKDYLTIRILYDLKRGWRYNTPNLEQSGLLKIGYNRLREFCERTDGVFDAVTILNMQTPEERYDFLLQLLNFFRTSFAFEYYKLTDRRVETEERMRLKLDDARLWSLDRDEKIDTPFILLSQAIGESNYRTYTASIGPQSYLGKYVRRMAAKTGSAPLHGEDLTQAIESICTLLHRGNFLRAENVRGSKAECLGYRLRIDKVCWELGNGRDVVADEVRIQNYYGEIRPKPNDFFRQFYQQNFAQFGKTLCGKEHTGQLNHQQRIDRENDFRKGNISALFCSPTMELGIDIRELNVVHMRNVPPNPANYAQRSGRAGRSGQAALIFTYCSNGSPHDRNYFQQSKQMVAGSVVPPTIDLTNEELIRSHFNAYILMELGLSDMVSSAADVLDVSRLPEIPLKDTISSYIRDSIELKALEWATQFQQFISRIKGIEDAYWYSDDWFSNHAKGFLTLFEGSFERWRNLFRAAERLVAVSRSVIDDLSIRHDNAKIRDAERDERIGKRQRELLLNIKRASYGNDSEFYVFRYLAAEGFLPGYNFTRLPIRAFLGYRYKDEGEFISRPRFVALKEFGPNNFIYHNGGKYRITRMQAMQSELSVRSVKISNRTGYALLDNEGKGVNNDPITREELTGQEFVTIYNNLLELGESEARPQERISCEEEERASTGYDIEQYFSFATGLEGTRKVSINEGQQPLLQVIYDQAAKLIQINRRWKISKHRDEGFAIGSKSGKWRKSQDDDPKNTDDPVRNVRIFTHDTADILYLQPIKELGLDYDGTVSLAFALKRALERQFQIEEGEIGVWIMGTTEEKNILVYEASEGSLGILSELMSNTRKMHRLFQEAYAAMHFDPETLQDLRPDLPKATYDDLLSYYNQRFHEQLDRFSIKAPLERLMQCTIDNQQGGRTLDEQYRYLMENYDLNSGTEKPMIDYLYNNGILLPDKAQFNVPGCYANADFVYKTETGFSLVFCDGSVHDRQEVREEDLRKRQCCRDAGFDVIEWHYRESLDSLVERRRDIFRKVR